MHRVMVIAIALLISSTSVALGAPQDNAALCKAATSGRPADIRRLIDGGAKPDAACDRSQTSTPLIEALDADRTENAKALISAGAKPDVFLPYYDHYYLQPGLFYVRSVAAAQLLIENGATVDGVQLQGGDRIPLLRAYYLSIANKTNVGVDIAKFLLEHGADPNFATSVFKISASSSNKTFALLLLDHGFDLTKQTGLGKTALDIAIADHNDELAAFITKHGGKTHAFRKVDPRRVLQRNGTDFAKVGIFQTDQKSQYYGINPNALIMYGTAFLVSPCLIMTNAHVPFHMSESKKNPNRFYESTINPQGSLRDSGYFRYGVGSNGRGFSLGSRAFPIAWGASTLSFYNEIKDDWSIARLETCDSDRNRNDYPRISAPTTERIEVLTVAYAGFPLEKEPNSLDDFELIVQANCNAIMSDRMTSDCQSAHGASGSPIFVMYGGHIEVFGIMSGAIGADLSKGGTLNSMTSYGAVTSKAFYNENLQCRFPNSASLDKCNTLGELIEADWKSPTDARHSWCFGELMGIQVSRQEAIEGCSGIIESLKSSPSSSAREETWPVMLRRATHRALLAGRIDSSALSDFRNTIELLSSELSTSSKPGLMAARCRTRALANVEMIDALADCNAALSANPSDRSALFDRAMVLIRLKRYADAEADLTKLLAAGKDADWYYFRALARQNLGRREEAAGDIKAAQAISADVAQRYSNFGFRL